MDSRHLRGRLAHHLAGAMVALALVLGCSALTSTSVAAAADSEPDVPACRIADKLTRHRGLTDWSRSLLDSTYRLSSKYRPQNLRSTSAAGLNGGYRVRKGVISDLRKMAAAARKASARFSVQSAYRSYATQKSTFAYWVRVHGYAVALEESARAGHSEHQLGTTLDLRSYRGRAPWDVSDWGRSKAGRWLTANSWKYGFVLSYPKGFTSVTCYTYEPWHFRYVGRTTARRVHASGLTLREYLWAVQTTGLIPGPPATPTPTPSGGDATPEPTPEATPSTDPAPAPGG